MRPIEHPFASERQGDRSEITEQTRQAVDDYLSQRSGVSDPYLFPGRGRPGHLSTRQYARLLDEWLAMIGRCTRRSRANRRLKAGAEQTCSASQSMAAMCHQQT